MEQEKVFKDARLVEEGDLYIYKGVLLTALKHAIVAFNKDYEGYLVIIESRQVDGMRVLQDMYIPVGEQVRIPEGLPF